MIEAYGCWMAKLNELGGDWTYPIHLGSLSGRWGRWPNQERDGIVFCCDGIGDTIRVSLTEDSVFEIPVAQALGIAD